MNSEILHPYAFDSGGSLVNIHDAQKGEPYLCVCCKNAMVVRKGKIKQPHFAHKQSRLCAEPDTVLHKTTQALIVQMINDAKSGQRPYSLGYPCPVCKRKLTRNIIPEVIEAKTEKSVIHGTRSDIAIFREGKQPVIIEVVVTHDLEPTTHDLYME